ncbi:MAG: c-type cytochrome [Verrucomicrobiae bacterium]|nr:c-type cytochrome [Verrucomicrobiae bacterium]
MKPSAFSVSGLAWGCLVIICLFTSCSEEARQSRGFHLPEGDVDAGKVAFVELKCTQCHSVAGSEFSDIKSGTGHVIGGEVRKIKTYGELVTSVIDPSHRISEQYASREDIPEDKRTQTPMPTFNSVMTVKQMCDIVTFLHSRYRETGPEFPDYPMLMP